MTRSDDRGAPVRRGPRTTWLILATLVIVVSTFVGLQWQAIRYAILTRSATPEEIREWTRGDSIRLTGRFERWPEEGHSPQRVGAWTYWYGETRAPLSRLLFSLDGEFLCKTTWLPNGRIQFQTHQPSYSEEYVTEPPWLYEQADRKKGVLDIRDGWIRSHSVDLIDLQFWDAPALRANRTTFLDVNLLSSNLTGATFAHASLKSVVWEGCRLTGADYRDARLIWCDFTAADLRNTNWNGASIAESDFAKADLAGATFDGTRLRNVDFREARNLTREQFATAIIEEKVHFPEF